MPAKYTREQAIEAALARLAIVGSDWEWTGYRNRFGYGVVSWNGKLILVHRLAAHIFLGFDLTSPLRVLHDCPDGDNPACFNPDHLWIGTQADNVRDMEAKGRGRHPNGATHHKAKLTTEQVAQIRSIRGMTNKDIARHYNVNTSTIRVLRIGRTWRTL